MPSHYWPTNEQHRALVDQFLEYYQQTFRPAMISPLHIKSGHVKGDYAASIESLYAQLDVFEAFLKQHEGRFIVNDEATIADLQLFFEFQDMIYLGLEWGQDKYPQID